MNVPLEDRGARDRCSQIEVTVSEVKSLTQRKASELAARMDSMEVAKDVQELAAELREERVARLDLGQTLDACRLAHLQTSNELRRDLDVAQEKLLRIESASQLQGGNSSRTPQLSSRGLVTPTPAAAPTSALRSL